MHIGIKGFSEACGRFKLFSDSVLISTNYCKHLISGAQHPQMNYVYDLNFNDPKGLAEDFSKLKSLRIPMMILCEAEIAASMGDYFERNGLALIGSAQSKMRSLKNFSYTPSNKIKIKEVDTPVLLEIWRNISAIGFGYPKNIDEKLFGTFMHPGEHHTSVKLFLSYLDDVAVGQSMLVLGDQFAGNMWSSVLPEYRHRGVLTEMINHRIGLAKKIGFETSVVQCMPMSASVYDKLNYQNKEIINLYVINGDLIQ
jgi:hypothetical protein